MTISCDTPFHRGASLDYPVQCCGNCKFWWGNGDPNRYLNHDDAEYWCSGAGGVNGQCRRYPPTLVPEHRTLGDGEEFLETRHPESNALHWCGEYQRRKPAAALELLPNVL